MKKEKVVLIDHNDSFTYNVVEVLRKIGNNKVVVIKYDDLIIDELTIFDKIILSPGPCLPESYPKTFQLIKEYFKLKPILGICLGHQAICSFFGGELFNINEIIHGVNKKILINDDSKLFKGVSKKTEVGLYHSWAVSKNNFPNDLKIIASSKDDMIMSIKHKEYDIFGIQFHPESFLTIEGKQILKNFIEL